MADADEEETGDLTPRQRRSAAMMAGTMLFAFSLTIGVPLIIGISYHLLGWQVAVFMFPVLFLLTFRALPIRLPKKNRAGVLRGWIARFILLGIPAISVYTNDPNHMRLWAAAVAGGMFVAMAADKRSAVNMTEDWIAGSDHVRRLVFRAISLGGAILFVLLSELIWRFLSLGPWIWFHAFAITIFTTVWISLIGLVSKLVSGEAFGPTKQNKIIKGKRPGIRSTKSVERYKIVHTLRDNSIIQYDDVSPEQAKWLFARVDWHDEKPVSERLGSIGENGSRFTIDFDWLNLLVIRPDGPLKVRIDWTFAGPRQKWHFSGERRALAAVNVPSELVNQAIDLAWAEKWDEIEKLLTVYIDPEVSTTL